MRAHRRHRIEGDSGSGSLTFRYSDDYKRPSPAAVEIAAAHPGLSICHEYSDEFGQVAVRQRFADGVRIEDVAVDAQALNWIGWGDGEE